MRFRDLTGQRFHSLLVLYKAKTNRADKTDWVCLCDCGKEVVCSMDHLTRKKILEALEEEFGVTYSDRHLGNY